MRLLQAVRRTTTGLLFTAGTTTKARVILVAVGVRVDIKNGASGDVQFTLDNLSGVQTLICDLQEGFQIVDFYLDFTAGSGQPVTVIM